MEDLRGITANSFTGEGIKFEEGDISFVPSRLLLATDASQEVALATQRALEIAEKTDSELHVDHVRIPPYHPSIFVCIYIGEYLQEERKEIERSAQELPDEQVGRIKAAGGSASAPQNRKAQHRNCCSSGGDRAGMRIVGSRGLSDALIFRYLDFLNYCKVVGRESLLGT